MLTSRTPLHDGRWKSVTDRDSAKPCNTPDCIPTRRVTATSPKPNSRSRNPTTGRQHLRCSCRTHRQVISRLSRLKSNISSDDEAWQRLRLVRRITMASASQGNNGMASDSFRVGQYLGCPSVRGPLDNRPHCPHPGRLLLDRHRQRSGKHIGALVRGEWINGHGAVQFVRSAGERLRTRTPRFV